MKGAILAINSYSAFLPEVMSKPWLCPKRSWVNVSFRDRDLKGYLDVIGPMASENFDAELLLNIWVCI